LTFSRKPFVLRERVETVTNSAGWSSVLERPDDFGVSPE
jgi:hypothetical protein